MNNPQKAVGIVLVLFLVFGAGFLGYSFSKERIIQVYIPGDGETKFVNIGGKSTDIDIVNVVVKGSIYEKDTRVEIFAACFDGKNQPVISNATIDIRLPNGTIFVNASNMTEIVTGQFRFNVTSPSTTGTYLSVVNCTDGVNYGLAFGEFQNSPSWVQKLSDMFKADKSAFETELEVITAFPNEEFRIELVFTFDNHTAVPDVDSLTVVITDPNENTKDTLVKSDFTQTINVWQADVSIDSTFVNGLYRFHANATLDEYVSTAKSVQARITTGAVFRYSLSSRTLCTNVNNNEIITVNEITNEGDTDTETICTNWLDVNNDGEIGADEPSGSFSKEIGAGGGNATEETSIIFGGTADTYTLRGRCTYTDENQPNATASTSVNIIACGVAKDEVFLSAGGGAPAGGVTTIQEITRVFQFFNTGNDMTDMLLSIGLVILLLFAVFFLQIPQRLLSNPPLTIFLAIIGLILFMIIRSSTGG